MKNYAPLIVLGAVLFGVSPAFALIDNDNLTATYNDRVTMSFTTKDIVYESGSATASGLDVAGSPDTTAGQHNLHFVAPFGGTILGISVRSNAAITTGYATFDVTVNNTATSTKVGLDDGNSTQSNYTSDVQRQTNKGVNSFVAGDLIGVRLRSQGVAAGSSPSPSGMDVVVQVTLGYNEQ